MINIETLTTDTKLIHKSGQTVTVTAVTEKYFKFHPPIEQNYWSWSTAWNDKYENSPNVGDFAESLHADFNGDGK